MMTLSEEDSKRLAQHIVEQMVVALSNEENVKLISGVWAKYLDQWIGRGFRRFAFYVLAVAVVTGAVKFQIWNTMFK
jgi:hypothetical protein